VIAPKQRLAGAVANSVAKSEKKNRTFIMSESTFLQKLKKRKEGGLATDCLRERNSMNASEA